MFLSFQIFKFSIVLPQTSVGSFFFLRDRFAGKCSFLKKSDYGVDRKDIYSIPYLNRRAKVVKNSCFNRYRRVSQDSVMVNFVKMLVETKNFAIYL